MTATTNTIICSYIGSAIYTAGEMGVTQQFG